MKLNERVKTLKENADLTWEQIARRTNAEYGRNDSGNALRKRYYRAKRRNEREKDIDMIYYNPTQYEYHVPLTLKGNIMFISDTHAPFSLGGSIRFLAGVFDEYNISHVLHVGDVTDQYALSSFDKEPDALGSENEFMKAKEYVKTLSEVFPDVYVTIGNHDKRHLRQAMKAGIPRQWVRDYDEILGTPNGWKWNYSYLINNSILVEHGTSAGYKATYDRALTTGFNVVQGHTHNYGGVNYINDGFKTRWAMNVGCLADQSSYALRYSTDRKYQHTYGCGIIVDNVPVFVPFKV